MIFSTPEPRRSGIVNRIDVPLGRYLEAAWDQGIEENAFSSISQMTENVIYSEGRKLTAEEANKKYSVPGLNFQEPVYETVARMMRDRHQRRLDRELMLESAHTFSGRWWGGLGVGVLSSFTNPLDFAMNFIPIVGSEKYAQAGARLGRGAFRQGLARGLVTEEALAATRVPFPMLTGALIEGAAGQAVTEIPILMAKRMNLEEYTPADSLLNMAAGSVLGGAIHLGVRGAAHLFHRLSPETKRVMFEQAAEAYLEGKLINVHSFVEIDEARIRERVVFDVSQARDEAYLNINEREIRRVVREKFDDEVVAAAIKTPDGKIHIGPAHYLIPEASEPGAIDGFLTAKGKFVNRMQAHYFLEAKARAESDDPLPEDYFAGEEAGSEDFGHFLLEDAADDIDFLREGVMEGTIGREGENQLSAKFRRDLKMREEEFFARPDVAKLVEAERQKQVAEFIERRQREYDPDEAFSNEVLAEIDRQIAMGHVLTPEQVKRYGFDKTSLERTTAAVDEDIALLEKELGIESEGANKPDNASSEGATGEAKLKPIPLNWVVTVQAEQKIGNKVVPGYVQIDDPTIGPSGVNAKSASPDTLRKEGYAIPDVDFTTLPHGKYEMKEALFLLDEKPQITPEEQALLDAVPEPETKAIDIAADCIRRNIK